MALLGSKSNPTVGQEIKSLISITQGWVVNGWYRWLWWESWHQPGNELGMPGHPRTLCPMEYYQDKWYTAQLHHYYHPRHPLREGFEPNVNQWITCLRLPLIDMALDSPQTTNYSSVQKITGFNFNVIPALSLGCGEGGRGGEREKN